MNGPIPGGPLLLLALPPGAHDEDWIEEWRILLDAWPGDRHVLDSDPHYVASWRRRALEHCAACWTVLPDPGSVPGVLAFSMALRAMVEDADVACVSIVPEEAIGYHPEAVESTPPFLSARYVSGGVLLVKSPLAAKVALPRPDFFPYDFAEAAFRMTQSGLRVLLLPDPSFKRPDNHALGPILRQCWHEGRGGTAFRLAHKGRAPRSLRVPRTRVELLLLGPWLIPSTAWRILMRERSRGVSPWTPAGSIGPILQSAALYAGALAGYSVK